MMPDLTPYLHPLVTLLAALLPVALAGLKARRDGRRGRDPP